MKFFALCLFLSIAFKVPEAKKIDTMVKNFFEEQMYTKFYDQWKTFRKPIENSIESLLLRTYGEPGMNLYVKRLSDPRKLSDGLFINDNILNVLFIDPYLMQLPHLTNPEVSFALASNVLLVEAKVDRMFIHAEYQLFRNLSTVTYASAMLDPFMTSPFNLQQVKSSGEVTIVAEDCILSGMVVTSLIDQTVNLGQNTIKVTNCKFYVEISTPGLGSPPVIAPYFSKEQGLQVELLLSEPLRDELMPILQGAVFTYVNTSSIFGKFLPIIRSRQQFLFNYVWRYMNDVTSHANRMALSENGGIEKWNDIVIQWSDKNDGELNDYKIVLRNMIITGLDSAYSARNGGPYRMPDTSISDTVRFSSLQIRGSLDFTVADAESSYVFYGEVKDMTSHVSIGVAPGKNQNQDMQSLKPSNTDRFQVAGWRKFELHAPKLPLIATHSLITGIVLNELPYLVIGRLSKSFAEAVDEADKRLNWDRGNSALMLQEDKVPVGENTEDNSQVQENDGKDDNNQEDIENEMNIVIDHQDSDKKYDTDSAQINENDPEEVDNEMKVVIEHQDSDKNYETDNAQTDKNNDNKRQILTNKNNMFGEGDGMKVKSMFDDSMFNNNMFGGRKHAEQDVKNRTKRVSGSEKSDGGAGANAAVGLGNKGMKTVYCRSQYINLESADRYSCCPPDMLENSPSKIEYRLFTRENVFQYILLDENAEPVDPNIIVDLGNAPLKIITHGWISSADDDSVVLIRDAYLETLDINIIAVDWRTLADTWYCVAALCNVDIVAKSISRFLEAVNERYGVSGEDIHLIGHSLGAHVVGIAASQTSFLIGRVTGLDPAGPIFELLPASDRIDSSCADFVDIIHTCGGILGFVEPIGHQDFFPNSGMWVQPGCENAPRPASCSHARSYLYYVDTIYDGSMYLSWRCDSWDDFLNYNCDGQLAYMGNGAVFSSTGKYYLQTLY